MRIHRLTPLLVVLTLACGGDGDPGDAGAEPTDGAVPTIDGVAAMEEVVDYWGTHYNLGHPDMVASRMAQDGLMWSANGTKLFGRDAIAANLAGQIEAASPQVQIEQDEALVFGDFGVGRGTYSLSGTADGQEFTNSGYWLSLTARLDGEWKIVGLVTNYDSPDQVVLPGETMDLPAPLGTAATVAERSEYYMTHFNLGHPSMVADTYTDDAVMMGSGSMVTTGKEAVLARLTGLTDAGTQINLIPFATQELDGGAWIAALGTYSMATPDQGTVEGQFHSLYQRVDGELKIHWLLTGNMPAL